MMATAGTEADISLQYKDSFIGDTAAGFTNNIFDDDGLYSIDHRQASEDEAPTNADYPILNAGPFSTTSCKRMLGCQGTLTCLTFPWAGRI